MLDIRKIELSFHDLNTQVMVLASIVIDEDRPLDIEELYAVKKKPLDHLVNAYAEVVASELGISIAPDGRKKYYIQNGRLFLSVYYEIIRGSDKYVVYEWEVSS